MRRTVSSLALGLALCVLHDPSLRAGFPHDASPSQAAAAAAAPPTAYTETIPGTKVSFEMVGVPGGTFKMGSPSDEQGRDPDEGPQHEVTVKAFWIGKFEVTWDEYDQYAFATDLKPQAAGSEAAGGADAVTRPTPPYGDESFGWGKGRQAAINMTQHAAMEYTRWLSSITGKSYRLPTEAEWEFAARGGTTGVYSFDGGASALADHAWYGSNAGERPHQVGEKKPNALGLHDMHGNVAEWCVDQYNEKA